MPDAAKVAVFVSGKGTNMAALLYASRRPHAAHEIVLVAAILAVAYTHLRVSEISRKLLHTRMHERKNHYVTQTDNE